MGAVRATRGGVIWIEEMLPKRDVIQRLSHATVFVCPSVYEPMGIVNLEAMACEAAVVATAVGGIPEVVEDGVTGLLVPYERADGWHRRARRPGRARGRSRCDDQRARGRPGPGRGDGEGGPGSGGRAVRMARRRPGDDGAVRQPAGVASREPGRMPRATNRAARPPRLPRDALPPPATSHDRETNPRTATRATSQRPRATSAASDDSACGSEPQRWSARREPVRRAGKPTQCALTLHVSCVAATDVTACGSEPLVCGGTGVDTWKRVEFRPALG